MRYNVVNIKTGRIIKKNLLFKKAREEAKKAQGRAREHKRFIVFKLIKKKRR